MSWYDIRFYVLVIALVFLFDGTPDVWDHLRDIAMGAGCAR